MKDGNMIKTWNERCEDHPDHQTGMVSSAMIQARMQEEIDALRTALEQQAKPVSHAVIAGALFDFMGWLTSRKERIVLSSADDASPAVDAIKNFAKMRGLSLDDAKVQDWNTTPPQRTWVGLTKEELDYLCGLAYEGDEEFILTVQAKLKEKNT